MVKVMIEIQNLKIAKYAKFANNRSQPWCYILEQYSLYSTKANKHTLKLSSNASIDYSRSLACYPRGGNIQIERVSKS